MAFALFLFAVFIGLIMTEVMFFLLTRGFAVSARLAAVGAVLFGSSIAILTAYSFGFSA